MRKQQIMPTEISLINRQGIGKAFGTFGELLQGILPGNKNFLVTLPIQKYSTCLFSVSLNSSVLHVEPEHKIKTLQFARKVLYHFNLPLSGKVLINSELEEGKGLASSTADLVATARAIENCYSLSIPISLLEDMIREIEPSDGIMYPGVVSYYHKEVKLKKALGSCPSISILAIDEGGTIDTIAFNQCDVSYSELIKNEYKNLLSKLTIAIETNDINMLGKVTTRSAELNQSISPKTNLDLLKGINSKIGGAGIVIAHSGTLLGIILSKNDPNYYFKLQYGISELKKQHLESQVFHSFEDKEEFYENIHN
ncbi:kinase [Rummeliibacillus suwonensis]|uniref:GHMP family kinase ATP-binding protein n=1 Tax=Rummeliibacillus suwonensis TaxID=1306154 RepID=UPI001AAFE72E|nr:kinase [Rummeliibacillus suwonensis]MBO2535976.1 kinase [Rummeliibacillus suwonensis]